MQHIGSLFFKSESELDQVSEDARTFTAFVRKIRKRMGIVVLALSHKNKREQNEMKKVKEKKIMRKK